MPMPRLRLDDTTLLVVDLQRKLLPVMAEPAAIEAAAGKLVAGAGVLGLPVVATEQYPAGLGATVPGIADRWPRGTRPHDKVAFSACIDPVRTDLAAAGRSTVLICGIETHVCVLHTALDLAAAGYVPAVAVDAVGSRRAIDHTTALRRLEQAGAVLTTVESALLEMVGVAGGERFNAILGLIK